MGPFKSENAQIWSLITFLTQYIGKKRNPPLWQWDIGPPVSILYFSFLPYFHFCVFSPIFFTCFFIFFSCIFQFFYWRSFIQYNIQHLIMGNIPLRVRGQVSMSLGCILHRYPKKHLNIHLVSSIISLPVSNILLSVLNFLYGISLCPFPTSTTHAIGLDHSLQNYFNCL